MHNCLLMGSFTTGILVPECGYCSTDVPTTTPQAGRAKDVEEKRIHLHSHRQHRLAACWRNASHSCERCRRWTEQDCLVLCSILRSYLLTFIFAKDYVSWHNSFVEIAVQPMSIFYLKVICTNLYITFGAKVDSVCFWCINFIFSIKRN